MRLNSRVQRSPLRGAADAPGRWADQGDGSRCAYNRRIRISGVLLQRDGPVPSSEWGEFSAEAEIGVP